MSLVTLAEPARREAPNELEKQPEKFVMLPRHARLRHPLIEERLQTLKDFAETFEKNEVEMQDTAIGIITSGACYQYAKEAFPGYSFLKLGMVYPLPSRLIKEFAGKVGKLYVFEELDPFLEEQIKALGIAVTGKEVFPLCGEFGPATAEEGIRGVTKKSIPGGTGSTSRAAPQPVPGMSSSGHILYLKKAEAVRHRGHRLLHPGGTPAAQCHGQLHLHGREHRAGWGLTRRSVPPDRARRWRSSGIQPSSIRA